MNNSQAHREKREVARNGAIVLVVGPSGAGKDSVIAFAQQPLEREPQFAFARRLITRAVDGTEFHEPCSHEAFEAAEAAGSLALSWRAHGTAYGIKHSTMRAIDDGRIVVANVSRRVIAAGVRLAPRALVVHVTASPEVLARRLQSRGRETAADIAARLAREAPPFDNGAPMLVINNDGPIEQAGTALLDALIELAGSK
jgi:ribose 1,5-bisphosphokinase